MNRKTTWTIAGAAVCAAVVVTAVAVNAVRDHRKETDARIMKIGDQTVTKEEFQMIVKGYSAQIKSGYTTDEANSEDFWTTEIDGQKPVQKAVELAVEELEYKKALADLAEEEGLGIETRYDALKEDLEEENEKRAAGQDSGEAVYGLQEFSLEEYYDYIYTDLESQVEEALKSKDEITDEEIRAVYDENIESYQYEVGVKVLVAEAMDGIEEQTMQDAGSDMADGMSAEELTEKYPDVSFYELEMNSQDREEGKTGVYELRWEMAAALQEGELSEVFYISGNPMVVYCEERVDNGTLSYEEVKGVLESQVKTTRAEQTIRDYADDAKKVYDDAELEKAAIEILGSGS